MKAEAFSLILLKNIWESREKRKLSLSAHLVLCAIGQGIGRRRDIISRCGLNDASFYSIVYSLMRDEVIIKVEDHESRMSLYELTETGAALYRRLFMYREKEGEAV